MKLENPLLHVKKTRNVYISWSETETERAHTQKYEDNTKKGSQCRCEVNWTD
jgi:hypothetical protein